MITQTSPPQTQECRREPVFSTFLQKPTSSIGTYNDKSDYRNEGTYRVAIKKQTSERFKNIEKENIVFQQEDICTSEQNTEDIITGKDVTYDYEDKTVCVEETNMSEQHYEELNFSEEFKEMECKQMSSSVEQFSEELNIEENLTEVNVIEEQLARIQQQLPKLSNLPSSTSQTLNSLILALADVVDGISKSNEDNEKPNNEDILGETDIDRNLEISTEGEIKLTQADSFGEIAVTTEMTSEEMNFSAEETSEVFAAHVSVTNLETEEILENQLEVKNDSFTQKNEIARQNDERDNIEIDMDKMREQRIVFQKQQLPFNPIQRPIILPGGRKWSEPDDASPPFIRKPKMSDEKICDAIETYSEVLVGKTKGINFLKYQPPPKNLDFLQRSEVYRLIHNMEPPVKGISIRPEKIQAEGDYYNRGN